MTTPEKTDRVLSVSLESLGHSRLGTVKEENQDAFLNWPEGRLWAVADGVSSHVAGGAASRMIMRCLMQIAEPASFGDHIANTMRQLESANSLLMSQKAATGEMAASTVVALLMHGGMAACIWAGDSRCYLLRGATLYQCSKDHSLRQAKIDSGELTVFEAQRMVKSHIITNGVGVKSPLTTGQHIFPVRAGDRFLLCSDGLTTLLPPESLMASLSRPSVRQAVDGLETSLKDMRQPDNITFITVFVSAAEAP